MRWMRKEGWPNVETKSCRAAGHRRVAVAEIGLSVVLAGLCGPRLGPRPRLSDFGQVFAAADDRLSGQRSGGSRFSRLATSRLRLVLAWSSRRGGDFDRQVLFRCGASGLHRRRVVDRCIGLEPVGRVVRSINPSVLPAFRQGRVSTKGMHKGKRYVKHKIEVFSAGCK